MRLLAITINGININIEGQHYKLSKDDVSMRCDKNELNDAIPEFEKYFEEEKRKLQLA